MSLLTKDSVIQACADAYKMGVGVESVKAGELSTKIFEAITSGGGGASGIDTYMQEGIAEISSDITSIRGYVLYRDHAVTSIDLPYVTALDANTFMHCVNLKSVNLPLVASISGNNNFYGCSGLESICLPKVESLTQSTFGKCTALEKADFPLVTLIAAQAFQDCSELKSLILRANSVATLENTSAFNNTPIKSGTGCIYVPSSVIAAYSTATNWSTFSSQLRVLEAFTVDGTTTGELDPTKI